MTDGPTKSMLLRDARLVLPQSVVEGKALLVDGNRISRIGDYDKVESSGETLSLEGLTLFPGFVDIHIHGAVGVDAMVATAEDLHLVARFLAREGVTSWLPTFVPAPDDQYLRAVEAIEVLMQEQDARPAAARVTGVHYEGPFVSEQQCGALQTKFFRTFAQPTDLDHLPLPSGTNVVRMMTLAPEIAGGVELIRELAARGWVVSLGHTRATVDLLDRACAAGAHHMTHFMNAMTPLHHRSPGPVGWGFARDDVTCDIIADGIHLDPLILSVLLKAKTSQRLLLISDAIAATGTGDGEYSIWGETITVKEGRTSNARGSIAGSVITMLDAVRMMRAVGATDCDIARMTATNPASLLRLDDYGAIEEGKRADLVALDDAGNVRLTIVGGRVAYQE
jgi:N-acetylglucosamine-6-phosphate deacetylase